MGMNAYGGMLTVLTGIDSFKTIKTSRALRAVTVIALAILWYAIGFAAEIPFMVLPPIAGLSYTGYFPSHLTNGVDYAWLIGLAVSGLVPAAVTLTRRVRRAVGHRRR
jgi:hypothetical protein